MGSFLTRGTGFGAGVFLQPAGHVAEVAEVSVAADKRLTVHDVWVAADVGQVINLSGVESDRGLSGGWFERYGRPTHHNSRGAHSGNQLRYLPALENDKGA